MKDQQPAVEVGQIWYNERRDYYWLITSVFTKSDAIGDSRIYFTATASDGDGIPIDKYSLSVSGQLPYVNEYEGYAYDYWIYSGSIYGNKSHARIYIDS